MKSNGKGSALLKPICDILDIDCFPDATVLEHGIIALHRPDVAKYAYDIEANAPLEPAQIDSLREWAREDCFEPLPTCFRSAAGAICGICWMKYMSESATFGRDLIVNEISMVRDGVYRLKGELVTCDISQEWLQKGQGVELLDGYRVVAVGRIT